MDQCRCPVPSHLELTFAPEKGYRPKVLGGFFLYGNYECCLGVTRNRYQQSFCFGRVQVVCTNCASSDGGLVCRQLTTIRTSHPSVTHTLLARGVDAPLLYHPPVSCAQFCAGLVALIPANCDDLLRDRCCANCMPNLHNTRALEGQPACGGQAYEAPGRVAIDSSISKRASVRYEPARTCSSVLIPVSEMCACVFISWS